MNSPAKSRPSENGGKNSTDFQRELDALKLGSRLPDRVRVSGFDMTKNQSRIMAMGFLAWGGKGLGKFIAFCVLDWCRRNLK